MQAPLMLNVLKSTNSEATIVLLSFFFNLIPADCLIFPFNVFYPPFLLIYIVLFIFNHSTLYYYFNIITIWNHGCMDICRLNMLF